MPQLGSAVTSPAAFPERAIQFGTGALLRGLVDAILDDANRAGRFGGRVVAIGSTGSGRDRALNQQQGLFTLRVEGVVNGKPHHESRIVSSISRALSAADDWASALQCARNPALAVAFSNTTEVGIALDPSGDDASAAVPASYPAKLTRLLHERARAFDYADDRGLVVIPCELIERNGDTLRALVLTLADQWSLGEEFSRWVRQSVRFCNTLVDRIITGEPVAEERAPLEQELGYRDALLTVCEPYRLLVIEGDDALRARLPFARSEFGVEVVDDVTPYRERKVRLLNGGHTAMVSLALLAGCTTVRDAVEHPQMGLVLRRMLFDEIVPTIQADYAAPFARQVLDRFANPYARHQLRDITLHGGAKMRVRVLPSIVAYADRFGQPPVLLTLGFAAYLLHARDEPAPGAKPDDVGGRIRDVWRSSSGPALDDVSFARAVCGDADLWGAKLDAVPGFCELVTRQIQALRHGGVAGVVNSLEPHLDMARRDSLTHAIG